MDHLLRELAELEALAGGGGASNTPVQHAPADAGDGGKQATTVQIEIGDDSAEHDRDPRRRARGKAARGSDPRAAKSQRRSVDTERQDADAREAETGVAEASATGAVGADAKSAEMAVRYADAPWHQAKQTAAEQPLVPTPPKGPPPPAQYLAMPPTSKAVQGPPPRAAPATGGDEGHTAARDEAEGPRSYWRPTGGRDGTGRFGARGLHANSWWFEARQKAFNKGPAALKAFYAEFGKAKGQPLYKEPDGKSGPPTRKATTHMPIASLQSPPPPPPPPPAR